MTIGQIWNPTHSDIQTLYVSSVSQEAGWLVHGVLLVKWIFCIHIHMNQVKTHPLNHTSWADLTKNVQHFGWNSNLDISRLASLPGSFIFSQGIRTFIKLVLSNFHVNQTIKIYSSHKWHSIPECEFDQSTSWVTCGDSGLCIRLGKWRLCEGCWWCG